MAGFISLSEWIPLPINFRLGSDKLPINRKYVHDWTNLLYSIPPDLLVLAAPFVLRDLKS